MKMMKKAAALLMTLMMVLTGIASLAEGAAVDTTWTEYSLWGYDHASIELGSQDGGCKVTVDWESSALCTKEDRPPISVDSENMIFCCKHA